MTRESMFERVFVLNPAPNSNKPSNSTNFAFATPTTSSDLTITNNSMALVAHAQQVAGDVDSASIAMAAIHANDSQQALILLAAASAKARMENEEAERFAEFRTDQVQETLINSDYTFEKRWKKAEDEKKVISERVTRLEAVTKQLVAAVATLQGSDANQVAEMLRNIGI